MRIPDRTLEDIVSDFDVNLERVNGLIDTYERLRKADSASASVQGRASVGTTDVLRSAVVFLHASFEDMLRGLEALFLPVTTDFGRLKAVGFPDGKKPLRKRHPKVDLQYLANVYGDVTVSDAIVDCVTTWLSSRSYNNWPQVRDACANIAFDPALLDPHKRFLISMMTRRHYIVHRADGDARAGSGHHPARSLSKTTVQRWELAVREAGDAILNAMQEREP